MKRHHLAIILFALASCKTGPSQPGLTGEPASGGASTQQGEENLMATSSFQYDLATGAASSFQTLASQGWSDQLMARYFYTDQGSMLMPYDLFVSLETEDGGTLFASYDNMSRYGFLAPTSLTTQDLAGKLVNPDKLPIGFTKHIQANNRNLYNQGAREWVGVTCAACHTQRVQFTTASGPVSYLINGGAAVNNHIIFMWELKRALLATLHDQKRLVSLASRITGRGSWTNAAVVKARITDFVGADGNKNFGARVNRSVPTNLNGLDREEARRRINHLLGTGRLDAFGNIFNEVNEKIVAGTLPHVPDAPVRYPHLWDSPVTDYVQTNAVTHAPLVRNIGEVLGVYGDF
ncbi:MAG: di-heme-cytochrome C peroxidase, partial [Proteobacteria bacterium]|nr:di-heme-cytochrome C peroxidase [Pseudomonadota bacterium]